MNRTAAIKAIRHSFEDATGLRTYSISFFEAGPQDLFEADAPWAKGHDDEVLEWMLKAEEQIGAKLDVDIRRTRMTVKFA